MKQMDAELQEPPADEEGNEDIFDEPPPIEEEPVPFEGGDF